MKGLCPKCKEIKPLTKHHIEPRKWFKKQKDPKLLFLCWDCHKEIHQILPKTRLRKPAYTEITIKFLQGDVFVRA